jgi:general secretion pathway protein D
MAQQNPTTLNFKDVDINSLIETVADLTGKNFVVDPRVKGKVTLVSSQPMSGDELYEVFLSILQVHGFSAIESGNVVKIVPDVSARQLGIPTASSGRPGSGDSLVSRVIVLKNINAAQLVPILRPLVPQQSHLAAFPATNVLVVTDRAENVNRLLQLINRIDRQGSDEIEVIRLEHASASETVRILGGLQQGGAAAKGQPATGITLLADERTNSVIIAGDKRERIRLRAVIAHLDTPLESTGNTKVIYLRYAQAVDMIPVLSGISGSIDAETKKGETPKSASSSRITIQADEATNALVITAPTDAMRSMEAVIRQLDIRRAQVSVEAIIAEVSLDKGRQLGVQWVIDGSPGGKGAVGGTNFSTGGVESSVAAIAAGIATGTGTIGDGLTIGAGESGRSDFNYGAVLRTLASDANTNILSTPSLVTMDNEESEIVVGQNVPFITGSFSSTGGSSNPTNPFQTIQREDIGLSLKVKPQINEGNAIKLEIEQEVSSIARSTVSAADIITNKRSLKTTVIVDDGDLVVLGGLIDEQLSESEQRVPLLGDIPILGWLFRYNSVQKIKRNLMVFIQPRIVRDSALSTRITGGKYTAIRERQLELRDDGIRLLFDDESPVLPPMRDLLRLPPPFKDEKAPAASSRNDSTNT